MKVSCVPGTLLSSEDTAESTGDKDMPSWVLHCKEEKCKESYIYTGKMVREGVSGRERERQRERELEAVTNYEGNN